MKPKVKVTALPERIRYAADNKNYACIDPNCKAHHDAEYVRADLLTTVRQEAHAAAEMRVLAKAIQQGVNAGKAAVIAAAANSVPDSEGEGVEDGGSQLGAV